MRGAYVGFKETSCIYVTDVLIRLLPLIRPKLFVLVFWKILCLFVLQENRYEKDRKICNNDLY